MKANPYSQLCFKTSVDFRGIQKVTPKVYLLYEIVKQTNKETNNPQNTQTNKASPKPKQTQPVNISNCDSVLASQKKYT